MTGLGWRLARLRTMGAREIGHRAAVALRDRLLPPGYAHLDPGAAFRALFSTPPEEALHTSRLSRLVRATDPADVAPEIEAARSLLRGEWTLFGHPVRLDPEHPRWNVNPRTGEPWPRGPSARIDYRRIGIAGDPKHTWELGRLTVLPVLAVAFRATGDACYAERALGWLRNWNAGNPLGRGIHHTSAIEMAVRVHTVCWTLALLGERARDADLGPCLGLLAQQALHCRDHLSLGSSANNHLIAEYAAMTTMGALFPALRGAEALLDAGLRGLERETLRQFSGGGVNAEQAFGYLPFIWELLLYPAIAAEAAGRQVSAEVRARLRASLEFARVIRLPDGRWPQIGDEDDGRVLLAAEGRSRLDLVGNALAAWLGADGLSASDGALARLLFGASPPARVAEDGVHENPNYTVWRDCGLHVTFAHAPLGLYPLAAHGHADALSLTIHRGADPVVIDPGTLAYHADREARDRCRSTRYHSTVHFGGQSQARMLGPFLWDRFPDGGPDTLEEAGVSGWSCRWTGGESHRRRIQVANGEIVIEDWVRGARPEVVFVLAPGARPETSGARATVTIGRTRATFEVEGTAAWRIEPGECAPRYAQRVPTSRLVAALTGDACRTRIRLGDA